jgi:hypothetical protein
VFVLAFGLETYHHHKYHSHHDEGHGGDHDGHAKEGAPSAAASVRESTSSSARIASLDVVQAEVNELGRTVREMRAKVLGDA